MVSHNYCDFVVGLELVGIVVPKILLLALKQCLGPGCFRWPEQLLVAGSIKFVKCCSLRRFEVYLANANTSIDDCT